MAENYKYIEPTGVVVGDTSDLQTEVETEFKFAFGQNLITAPYTPQGVLITDETLARATLVRNNAQLANQINPNLAGGIFLDAIWALTGGKRSKGTYTVVPGQLLSGVPGTVIPTSVRLSKATGELFEPVSAVTLDGTGNATVDFKAVEVGQIDVAANSLTTIAVGELGLETTNNPNPGIPGTDQQTDEQAKLARNDTLALQSNGLAEAVLSRLAITPAVTSATFRENETGGTLTIDGVTMLAHSMYACVDGGTDLAVATTITGVKGGGCNYNNGPGINISQPITNPFSGQTINVLFDRPNLISIVVQVTVSVTPAVTDPVAAVKQAVLNYVNGLVNGEPGLKIGTEVSSFQIAGAVNQQVIGLFVQLVQCKKASGGSFSSDPIAIAIFERAIVTADSITVILV